MRILTAQQTKAAEKLAFEKYYTEAQLMKSAGEKCFQKLIKLYGERIYGKKVSVVCGNGKNAGDGFVIARLLKEYGCEVVIVIADKFPEISEPAMYLEEAEQAGVTVEPFEETQLSNTLIVDCIFGIGFHGEPREPFGRVIDAVNESNAAVVSVDTPSGADASSGAVFKAVKAQLTIAVSTLKYCHILPPANNYCGRVVTVDIGIPDDCYTEKYPQTITKSFVKSCFPQRNKNSNKGQNGHLLSVCGSYQMPGAAVMAAKAALVTGVGLLKCVFPRSVYTVMTSHLVQPLFCPVSENEDKTLSMGALNRITQELEWADCVALGCGIGKNDDTEVIVNQILRTSEAPVVLDADGINCVCSNIDVLNDAHAGVVLTPHPGEMARLTDLSVAEIEANRIKAAADFARKYSCVLVLKGANTVVTDGREVFVNTTGNPGMAMGGTGDMLTGMIASFIAQGTDCFSAARAAVYIHGLCGDLTAREISTRGMTVEDMLQLCPALLREFE